MAITSANTNYRFFLEQATLKYEELYEQDTEFCDVLAKAMCQKDNKAAATVCLRDAIKTFFSEDDNGIMSFEELIETLADVVGQRRVVAAATEPPKVTVVTPPKVATTVATVLPKATAAVVTAPPKPTAAAVKAPPKVTVAPATTSPKATAAAASKLSITLLPQMPATLYGMNLDPTKPMLATTKKKTGSGDGTKRPGNNFAQFVGGAAAGRKSGELGAMPLEAIEIREPGAGSAKSPSKVKAYFEHTMEDGQTVGDYLRTHLDRHGGRSTIGVFLEEAKEVLAPIASASGTSINDMTYTAVLWNVLPEPERAAVIGFRVGA